MKYTVYINKTSFIIIDVQTFYNTKLDKIWQKRKIYKNVHTCIPIPNHILTTIHQCLFWKFQRKVKKECKCNAFLNFLYVFSTVLCLLNIDFIYSNIFQWNFLHYHVGNIIFIPLSFTIYYMYISSFIEDFCIFTFSLILMKRMNFSCCFIFYFFEPSIS